MGGSWCAASFAEAVPPKTDDWRAGLAIVPRELIMTEHALIALLADGNFHSGEKLGALLGVSRTAVWKQLQKLESIGIELESVKGLGYRIAGGLDLLDREAVLASMGDAAGVCTLTLLGETVSTNDWVKATNGSWRGVTCLAERQLGGRGRRGRSWVSPYGRNLYLSMGWEFEGGVAALEGLSLAVGVTICRILGGQKAAGVALKWPNDVLFEGRKLAGVLVELQGDPSGVCQVVVGVGINHHMGPAGKAIDQPWADATEVVSMSRSELAGRLIGELAGVLEVFSLQGFSACRDEWSHYDVTRDQPVTLMTAAGAIEGVARGITEGGALLVETGSGIETFHGGEVSLRVRHDP